MSRLTRSLAAVPLAAALSVSLALPAQAAQDPDTIRLKTGSMPEGISAGPGSTFFAGARSDGDIYVGDTATGKVKRLAQGDGDQAVGMLYDPATNRLWVAGGTSGDVTAYDGSTGRVLFVADVPGTRFLNDVTITPDAVYVTDSRSAQLVVLPTPGGALPAPGAFSLLDTTIPAPAPGAFGPNGIRDLASGELLVVSQGDLYRVDPVDGSAERVTEQGQQLTAGDGLVLDGSTLYVVYGVNGRDSVVQLTLDAAATTATFVREIGEESTSSDLDRPTTGALIGGDLYVVNGRFTTIATQPDAPVYVSRLDL